MEDFVLFQGVAGNRFLFHIETDGTFTSGPGVTATLTENAGPPITYTLVTSAQTELTFDENGDILERTDSEGRSFTYSYDEVGNRLTQDTLAGTNTYAGACPERKRRNIANRLTSVDGVAYTWDNNGNLLSDGASTYVYNYANMLSQVNQAGVVYDYLYNGLGDRLQQAVDGAPTSYTLDINTGLTQVLADGMNTYLYGNDRIAQEGAGVEYFLGDALSSVRQLVDLNAEVTLRQSYEPYGSVMASEGEGESIYQFTGEITDSYIKLIYLRSRYMSVETGRFVTKDVWEGDYTNPMTYNKWIYANNNPVLFIDPSGNICLNPFAPSGFHLNPNRGCEYYGDIPSCNLGLSPDQEIALDLAVSIQLDEQIRGSRLFWDGLDPHERQILSQGGWDRGSFNDFIDDDMRRAKLLEDPAFYVSLGVSGLITQGPKIISAIFGGQQIVQAETQIDGNRIHHIFNKPGRDLSALESMFGGDRIEAYRAVSRGFAQHAGNYTTEQLHLGIPVNINGLIITVRGEIVNGIARISTFFIK